MAHNHQNVCNFCNNTSDTCCSEADAHVFMLNGLLVAKDVVMPLEQGGN